MVYVAFLRGVNVGGKGTGVAIKVLVMDHRGLKKLVDAIPRNWVDDKAMRTYVLLLWKELDDRKILERLPVRPGVDNVRYAPGAVIWQVDRKDIAKRSVNTMRKLNELTAEPA